MLFEKDIYIIFDCIFFFQKGVSQTVLGKMDLSISQTMLQSTFTWQWQLHKIKAGIILLIKKYLILCPDDTHYSLITKLR